MLLCACTPPASTAKATAAATPTATATTAPASQSASATPELQPVVDPLIAEEYPDCKLTQYKGSGVSAWAYDCPTSRTTQRTVADPSLPGFKIESTNSDQQKTSYPVIRVFTKAADAPVTAILAQVQQASPVVAGATCALTDITADMDALFGAGGPKRFSWQPTGKSKQDWDAVPVGNPNGVTPPCGAYGVQLAEMITFEELKGDPTKVVMLSWGAEMQIFVPSTVKAAS